MPAVTRRGGRREGNWRGGCPGSLPVGGKTIAGLAGRKGGLHRRRRGHPGGVGKVGSTRMGRSERGCGCSTGTGKGDRHPGAQTLPLGMGDNKSASITRRGCSPRGQICLPADFRCLGSATTKPGRALPFLSLRWTPGSPFLLAALWQAGGQPSR